MFFVPPPPRMRRMMRMRMMMRMMMKMKTMSPRAAAPALPPQGTPRTLTPTEAQPHLGCPSPNDHLCFSPLFCPLPPPISFFLSFFLNKIWWGGEGLEEPKPARTLQTQRHQPWGPSRECNHQTEPPLDRTGPPLCTCGSGMDNGPGSGVGVPESSVRPSTPASQPKGGGAWGGPLTPRGACCLDPYIGTGGRECGERRVGACESIGTAP